MPTLSASRDSLNPALNLETLKNRLWVMEYYRTLNGVEYTYWPHYTLRNLGRHVNKYKLNYIVKGFVLYNLLRSVQASKYASSTRFLRLDEMFAFNGQIAYSAALAGAALFFF